MIPFNIEEIKSSLGETQTTPAELFKDDENTKAVVMIGEIGGTAEEEAATYVKAHYDKPVIGFIAGRTAPPGRRMGHAGAIVSGEDETAEAKKRIMSECGIHVVDSPADIGSRMAELIG